MTTLETHLIPLVVVEAYRLITFIKLQTANKRWNIKKGHVVKIERYKFI